MKFSLENTKPARSAVENSGIETAKRNHKRARAPLPGENTRARLDEKGISANAYLKTAMKAKDGGNFRREVHLLEKAIITMGHKDPSILRRYAAALYKIGEYRASWIIIADPIASEANGKNFAKRLKSKLAEKDAGEFSVVLAFN